MDIYNYLLDLIRKKEEELAKLKAAAEVLRAKPTGPQYVKKNYHHKKRYTGGAKSIILSTIVDNFAGPFSMSDVHHFVNKTHKMPKGTVSSALSILKKEGMLELTEEGYRLKK